MAATSVIQVNVEDGAFKTFKAQFDAFEAAVKAQPAAWAAVGKTIQGTAGAAGALGQAVDSANDNIEKVAAAQDKVTKQTVGIRKVFEGLTNESANLAKNVAGITVNLLKWVGISGIFTGLLGGGSLFGLDRLARTVSDSRYAANSTGATYGEAKSFNVNYGRFGLGQGNLENVARARSSYADSQVFSMLGINQSERDKMTTGDLAVRSLQGADKLFGQYGGNSETLGAMGVDKLFSMDQLRAYHAASPQEKAEVEEKYRKGTKDFDLGDKTTKAWADLLTALTAAGEKIENVLVKGLTPLAKPLADLSDKVAEAIKIFLANPKLKEWMDDLGSGIEQLAIYLGTDKFQKDVKEASEEVINFGKSIGAFAKWMEAKLIQLGVIADPEKPEANKWHYGDAEHGFQATPDAPGASVPLLLDTPGHVIRRGLGAIGLGESGVDANGRKPGEAGYDQNTDPGGRRKAAWDFFKSKGLSDEAAAAQLGNIEGESGLDPSAAGDKVAGRATAFGLGQWHAPRVKAIKDATGIDVEHDTNFTHQLEAYWAEQEKSIDPGAGQALKSLRGPVSIQGGVKALVHDSERSKNQDADVEIRTKLATKNYNRFHRDPSERAPESPRAPTMAGVPSLIGYHQNTTKVLIQNATGGNVVVSAKQIAV